jgi:flagellar biogenesis protein FliO
MAVVESLRLSNRQSIHLVKVAGKKVLIGATDQSITLLSEVDLEADSDTVTIENFAVEPAPSSFGTLLNSIFVKDATGEGLQ